MDVSQIQGMYKNNRMKPYLSSTSSPSPQPVSRLTSESELSSCAGSWICGPNLILGLCKDIINSWAGRFTVVRVQLRDNQVS